MSLQSAQLVVVVTARPGDEAVALPARLSEITGRSRTQLAIELQRGEVEVLRSEDRDEVSRIVEQLAAVGLLAVVREAALADQRNATPAAGEGWGRVLGAFDAKVAVAPSRLPERPAAGRPAEADGWQPAESLPLRLSESAASASSHRDGAGEGRLGRAPSARSAAANEVALDLLSEAAGSKMPPLNGVRRGAKRAASPLKRPSARAVVIALTLLFVAGLGFAVYQRMQHALAPVVAPADGRAPSVAPAEPALDPTAAFAQPPTDEQVRLLVDRAQQACRSADFERCKELADQALDLDETNRAAQSVHIQAVTSISAQAGRPAQNPTPPSRPQ